MYYYLDATPTHSYLKMLYKYPQREFPYEQLVDENRRRGKQEPEFELLDTGVFDDDRYFDVFVEYAKAAPDDILMRVTVHNRGPEAAPSTSCRNSGFATRGRGAATREQSRAFPSRRIGPSKPSIARWAGDGCTAKARPNCSFARTKRTRAACTASLMRRDPSRMPSTSIVIRGRCDAVNSRQTGTKAAAHYVLGVAAWGQPTDSPAVRAPARILQPVGRL